MQGKTWIELFERIPVAFRDGLGIVTSSGTEINLQAILRLEEEFMVFRGRLMGSTEAQRTFFLPYAQINVLLYQRVLKEEEVQAWFGDGAVPAVSAPAEETAETPAEEQPAGPAAAAPAPVPVQRMDSAPLPGKAAILERLRSKRAMNTPGPSSQGTTPKPPPK